MKSGGLWMGITKGNSGEWSEPYVLLSLLSEGRIYDADANLNVIKDVWHDISSIIFKQDSKDKVGSLRYDINPNDRTVDVFLNGTHLIRISRDDCKKYANGLCDAIKNSHSSKGTIDIDKSYSDYLRSIGRNVLKASSKDTPDIWLDMPDARNTSNKPLGFSIKSRLSSHLPTIFNSSGASNIIYEITGDVTEEKISELKLMVKTHGSVDENADKDEFVYPDYPLRIKEFKNMKLGLKYHNARTIKREIDGSIIITDEAPFEKNLRMIDCCMPQILADMTAEAYFNGIMNMKDLVSVLDWKDRFGAEPSADYPFYKKKVQDMLVAMTTSMTAGKVWDGTEGTNGGLIIVKEDGDIVCYHIFDRNDFREFLLSNMKFECPDNSRYFSTGIVEMDGKYYMSLNVQIRMGQKKKKDSVRMEEGYYDIDSGEYLDKGPLEKGTIWF